MRSRSRSTAPRSGGGRAAPAAGPLPARGAGPDRHPHRLRHQPLRRLHRPARRPAGQVLHRVRRAGRRPRDPDGRGAGQGRQAAPDPGRLLGGARPAVRLLHAGHDDDRLRPARRRTPTRPRPRSAEAISGNLCRCTGYVNIVKAVQHAAAQLRSAGAATEQAGEIRRSHGTHERRPKSAAWAIHEAQGGSALISGKGNYVDDVKLPGMLYMDIVRSPYAHAKIKNIDTSRRSNIPGVAGGDHRQGSEAANLDWMPTLMSDTQMVLPIEQGDVPGPGGGGGDRHRPLHRGRRRRGGRGRVRAAAGGGRSVQGARDRRAGPAHRQGGQEQPHLPLGGRATRRRPTAPSPSADVVVKQDIYIPRIHVASIETCGCVADFDKTTGQLHRLHDHPGAARHPHRVGAGHRHPGGEDPGHLARHRRRLRRQGAGLSRLRHARSPPR